MNGKLIGFHGDPKDFVESVREKRRKGEMPFGLSVTYYKDLDEVYINTDEGRTMRPLVVVSKGESRLTKEIARKVKKGETTFTNLVKEGIVEFLDA